MRALTARIGKIMAVGNEGAGVVVAAAASPEAQALLGRTVGFIGGATYGEYCLASPRMCLPLPEDADVVDDASSFVNPLTALGMVETMRNEGHTGLVHTAAASNLVRASGSAWPMRPFGQRVADELTTTFASHYIDQLSLSDALDVGTLQRYARQATGEKFLLRPQH